MPFYNKTNKRPAEGRANASNFSQHGGRRDLGELMGKQTYVTYLKK